MSARTACASVPAVSESALVATAGLGVSPADHARTHRARMRLVNAIARRITRRVSDPQPEGLVVFITGPSGSGKSTILDRLRAQAPVARTRQPSRLRSKRCLVDWIHPDPTQSMRCLAACGLADAHAFLTSVQHLSTGQRARAALARALARTHIRPIACDEFGSGLDPLTAEALSRCAGRAFRAQKRTLIAASAREELIDALRPDVLVYTPLYGEPELHERDRS